MFEILQDIRTGALPVHEIPGFALWLVKKNWLAVAVIVCVAAAVIKAIGG